MKAEILKIAGVKNEKEFYKKFPSEEAFMKMHGKAFKKAKLGKVIAPKAQVGIGLNSPAGGTMTGMQAAQTNPYMYGTLPPLDASGQTAMLNPNQNPPLLNQRNTGTLQQQIDASAGAIPINKFNTALSKLGGFGGVANIASDIIGGIQENKKEKEAMLAAQQQNEVSKVGLQAAMLKPERKKNTYDRPDDPYRIIQPDQLFPSYGVGTNVLTAREGSVVKAQYGCKGKSCTQTGEGKKKVGGINIGNDNKGGTGYFDWRSLNTPVGWNDLLTYNSAGKKGKELTAYNKGITARTKSLQAQFPGVTEEQVRVAGGDSSRIQQRMGDLPRYDQPSEQTFDKAYHQFYRPLMDQKTPVTVEQILNFQTQQPGGLGGFKTLVQGNYGRKKAQDGMQIGGNQTEIQNMYNPGDLYSDLGYEPLSDSDIIKQYRAGGLMQADAGSMIGKGIGTAAGSFVPIPGASQFLGFVGGMVGDALDRKGEKTQAFNEDTQKNVGLAAGYSAMGGVRSQFSSFVRNGGDIPQQEEGGWVSNDWMPQTITQFGEHSMKDLLRPDPMMDTLRTGGIMKAQKGFTKPLLPSNPSGYADSVISANPNIQYYKDVLAKKAPEVSDFPGMFSETEIRGMDDSSEENPYVGARTGLKPYLSYVNGKYVPIEGMLEAYQDNTIPLLNFPSQYAASAFEEEMKKRTKKQRTGGHISQNKMYPQDRYALGGELKTTWGGHAETMSHNPYLPGTGETVMFRGKSHEESDGNGHTGIGVKYGEGGHDSYTDYAEYGSENADADVEVERGEPAAEMIDEETGEKNMVVFGNLKIPNQFLDQIGDPKAKGKKFKTYIAGISKDEARQNKIIEKTSRQIDEMDVYTPFDKLKLDALQAMQSGADMKLKNFAEIKKNASVIQDAINETAKENGVDADALAKGKIKIDKQAQKEMAKYGKEIFKAQTGTTTPATVDRDKYEEIKRLYKIAQKAGDGSQEVEDFQKKYHEYFPDFAKEVILNEGKVTAKGKAAGYKNIKQLKAAGDKAILSTNVDKYFGPRTEQYLAKLEKAAPPRHKMTLIPSVPVEDPEPGKVPPMLVPPVRRDSWMDVANAIVPYIRPSDVDYNVDLYPEITAAAMNQEEPVFAQSYQPQLLTPYDISYQDQLNEVTAQARAAERMAGQNPAAAASILGTASGEKNKVLGEQFRQNQAQRMGVYNQNIATLNDAKLKNIGIYADQAAKQSQARSNTKAQAMEIIKSMSDKIAKNKLENKTLQTYENLYNYRFGKDGRAQNYNPFAQFDVTRGGSGTGKSSGGIAPGYEFTYDSSGNIIGTRKSKEDKDARNGSIVRALKNF